MDDLETRAWRLLDLMIDEDRHEKIFPLFRERLTETLYYLIDVGCVGEFSKRPGALEYYVTEAGRNYRLESDNFIYVPEVGIICIR